jgi:hypothetical protein
MAETYETMDRRDLRIRANQEVADLEPEPVDPDAFDVWVKERRAAVVRLAELADRNAQVLRDAAIGEWIHAAARDLLLDAAAECSCPA